MTQHQDDFDDWQPDYDPEWEEVQRRLEAMIGKTLEYHLLIRNADGSAEVFPVFAHGDDSAIRTMDEMFLSWQQSRRVINVSQFERFEYPDAVRFTLLAPDGERVVAELPLVP